MILYFPYRAETETEQIPWTTIIVVVLCFVIFLAQNQNDKRVKTAALTYCQTEVTDNELKKALGHAWGDIDWSLLEIIPIDGDEACARTMTAMHYASDKEDVLYWLRRQLSYTKDKGGWNLGDRIPELYQNYKFGAPSYLTGRIVTERPSWNIWRWFTGTLAHADWSHLIFNLIFFVIFALTVEAMLGSFVFGFTLIAFTLGINLFDNIVFWGEVGLPATLGLSGVVSGVIALFAYLAPHARVRFFYWLFLSVGTVSLPGWLVIVWYAGWDAYYQVTSWGSGINYGAHLAGVAMGLILGLVFFKERRHWTVDLDAVGVKLTTIGKDINRDTTGFRYIETLSAAPLYLATIYIVVATAYTLLFYVVFKHTFIIIYLLPAVGFALWYRAHKRRFCPDQARLKEALNELKHNRWQPAEKLLAELAERGHTRAQFELGKMYAQGNGVPRIDGTAEKWYRKAATNRHRDAQYLLGLMLNDGRAVIKSAHEDLYWLDQAAAAGHGDAAMALAHHYVNRRIPGLEKEDAVEKTINYYRMAGETFIKEKRRDDAIVALREIEGHDRGNTSAQVLAEKLGLLTNI